MRSPTSKDSNERRKAERRGSPDRRSDSTRAVTGERRAEEQRGVAHAMVDALEDILKWERASERSIRVADASKPDLSN
jgi:hypothetical protein